MDGVRTADGRGADFAEADAADLSFLDKPRENLNGGLDGDVGVDARALEDVNLLDAVENADGLLDGGTDALRGAVRDVGLGVVGALDAQDDLVGVLWVLLEVMLEQVQRVSVGSSVVNALLLGQYTSKMIL